MPGERWDDGSEMGALYRYVDWSANRALRRSCAADHRPAITSGSPPASPPSSANASLGAPARSMLLAP